MENEIRNEQAAAPVAGATYTYYTYSIEYSDGRRDRVDSEEVARAIIAVDYPDAVIHDQWEPLNYDGTRERLLVWEHEENAGPLGSGDDGARSIAEIIREES